MNTINIVAKNFTSTILDLNIIDINKVNFYNILGSVYSSLQKDKSQFYYETDINYQRSEMVRLAIFKSNNDNCIIRFYKTHMHNRKNVTILLEIELTVIGHLLYFITNILQGNNAELSIGMQSISVNITNSNNKPILRYVG